MINSKLYFGPRVYEEKCEVAIFGPNHLYLANQKLLQQKVILYGDLFVTIL